MLNLTFKAKELFNESTNQFVTLPSCEIKMEHSLFVLSKWNQSIRSLSSVNKRNIKKQMMK